MRRMLRRNNENRKTKNLLKKEVFAKNLFNFSLCTKLVQRLQAETCKTYDLFVLLILLVCLNL